ncbi:MAG: ABC transporter ATP-binding protein [Micrococcaceae bacterium]
MHSIQIKNLMKSFQSENVLNEINLTIDAGERVGLIGNNGSGKTTLMKIIAGQAIYDSGSVSVLGRDPRCFDNRFLVSYLLQENSFPESLKLSEVASFISKHFEKIYNLDELFELFQLSKFKTKKVAELSGGLQRSFALLLSFIGKPRILLLDEPTVGLDETARQNTWNLLNNFLDEDVTILVTSHYKEDIDQLTDKTYALNRGELRETK